MCIYNSREIQNAYNIGKIQITRNLNVKYIFIHTFNCLAFIFYNYFLKVLVWLILKLNLIKNYKQHKNNGVSL